MNVLRLILCVLPLALAAGLASALEPDEARHLLARTGFGGTARDIAALAPLSREQAVRALLDGTRTRAATPPPDVANEPLPDVRALRELRTMDETARKAFQRERREQMLALKGWWYAEMLDTDSPLTERMTLFWHNHFTSSIQKVKALPLLYRQNVLLREHATGNFARLLHAIARDPAMVLYLDGQTNHKDAPNENFARELLELFTLGEGYYSERDIKEAARAFTGGMVQRPEGAYRFNPARHDTGVKIFLGRSGAFKGEDILSILLLQSRTAEHIVGKLWREFIGDVPDTAAVSKLAAGFRDSGYEIKPLLLNLFLQPAFWDERNRGTLIKSPVELLVGTVRLLDISLRRPEVLALAARGLGQDVFDPPNVKGWPGGRDWITANTLLLRQQFLERITRGLEMPNGDDRPMPRRMTGAADGAGPVERFLTASGGLDARQLQVLLLAIPPVQLPEVTASLREQVEHWLLDPAYQLK